MSRGHACSSKVNPGYPARPERSFIGASVAILATWGPGVSALGAADAPLDPPQFVFFAATDGATRGLWRTNGTAAGTSLVIDLEPGGARSIADAYQRGTLGTLRR